MDREESGGFPFLDIFVTKKVDNTLGPSLYRKSTHTNRLYLHTESHHGLAKKKTVDNPLTCA